MVAEGISLTGQGLRVLRLYHLYRLTIGLVLVLLISSDLEDEVLKLVHPELFHVGSWGYLVFNILVAVLMPTPRQLLPLFILAALDILLLSALFYTAGGIPSGIGSLLVVAVAIANILLRGRIGLVIAAIASHQPALPDLLPEPEQPGHRHSTTTCRPAASAPCASPPPW